MGHSVIPQALQELASPTSPEARVNALRSLKNEIVGHDQRKELAVRHGLIKPLAAILRAEARKGGKRRRSAMNGSSNGNGPSSREGQRTLQWSIEDELRFQATLVVGSLANGGPAFIAPLLAGAILPPLLEALSPQDIPTKLMIATLRTLNQITDAVAQEKPWADSSSSVGNTVCEQIYTRPVVDRLSELLAQPIRTSAVAQEVALAAKLIAQTCRDDSQRKLLIDGGVLDQLASKLSEMAAVDAQSLRQELQNSARDELPAIHLHHLLEAISAVIKDSYYNTARFLFSQPIRNVFGSSTDGTTPYDGITTPTQTTPWERLTPRLQTPQNKSNAYTKAWPALGTYGAGTSESYGLLPSIESLQSTGRTVANNESENSLFIWLMYIARRSEGKTRLSACWLLALLKKFGEKWPLNDPSKGTRDRHYSYLIVPLVVKMVEDANSADASKKGKTWYPQSTEENRFMLERSPLVLAELVAGNKTLQNAANDARVLPTLVQILKKSFDPIPGPPKAQWTPRPSSPQQRDPNLDQPSSTLGSPGLGSETLHAFRYRETVLLALAAMADSQDVPRRHIIEYNAANHIIEALVPFSESPSDTPETLDSGSVKKMGNPVPVLIAACKVIRSLSRSISVLRTSLIDHGVAQPSFELLTHSDIRVQIAATEVITNLVLEVSPMRNGILEAGALKTLCEHCRSANFDLRYGSLWALKHLCLGLSFQTKMQCLDELGVGWLTQVLHGESNRGSASTTLGMGTPNAAGEQVDILNAIDDPHMDVDDEISSEEEDEDMARRLSHFGGRYHTTTSKTSIKGCLQAIKNDEQDLRLKNERDDIRLQEQALDFIRNLINEDKASGTTIDNFLHQFGHSSFFEILDEKIRPKPSGTPSQQPSQPHYPPSTTTPSYWSTFHASSRLGGTSPFSPPFTGSPSPSQTPTQPPTNWSLYPPTELIISTLYILVHLANGRPQHRSMLISQTQLMTHILPLLSHPRRDVRLPCAWFINNLTWVEDNADETASRERAQILRSLGYEEGARLLGRDSDMDIRERAKTAMEQMGKLLGVSGSAGLGEGGLRGLGGLGSPRGWGRDGL